MHPKKYNLLPLQGIGGICLLLLYGLIPMHSHTQQPAWTAPKDAAALNNPVAPSAAVLADAKVIYSTNCGPCHGTKGKGDGPAAQALTPKPADHTSTFVQSESDGSLFWKLSEGRNPMPSYKKILTDQQRWELVIYIRSLSKPARKG